MADDYRGLFEAAIARLQPGSAMERAAFEGVESGKRTAVGGAIQSLVSGGMAGSSLAGSVPLIAEKSAAASRLGVTAAREQQLSNVQMQLGGLLFQGTEREKAQQFAAGESLAGRQFAAGESLAGRQFAAAQDVLARQFTGAEAEKGRQFSAAQNALSREFEVKQAELNRQFSTTEARKSEAYQSAQTKLTHEFQANQATLDRQYGVSTQARAAASAAALQFSAQQYGAQQTASGQQYAAGQSALDRAAQASLQASTQQYGASQQASAQQYGAEQNRLQLAAQYPSLAGGDMNYSPAPRLFGGGTAGGGTTGGWSSYLGSGGGSLGAPLTGQSWVNSQYVPTAAEQKTFYSKPTAAGPISMQTAMQNIQKTVREAPGGTSNPLGWNFPNLGW